MQNIIDNFIVTFAIFIIIYGVYLAVSFVLTYVFFSIGTYRLMEKRKIPNSFLAWIPIAQEYAFGHVYDDIKKKENSGADPHFRIIMLILALVYVVFGTQITITSPTSYGTVTHHYTFGLSTTLSLLAGITLIVFYLIGVKKIFEKYAPNKGSYFALTIVFIFLFLLAPFVPALCLMKASNNDSVEDQQLQTDR